MARALYVGGCAAQNVVESHWYQEMNIFKWTVTRVMSRNFILKKKFKKIVVAQQAHSGTGKSYCSVLAFTLLTIFMAMQYTSN